MTEKGSFFARKHYMVSKISRKTISIQNLKGSPHLVPEVLIGILKLNRFLQNDRFTQITLEDFIFLPIRLSFFVISMKFRVDWYIIMTTFGRTAQATIFYALKAFPGLLQRPMRGAPTFLEAF